MKKRKPNEISTEVLIAGGSASGVCAAIQAARQGAKVVLVEETPWLGGMLSAAGVSATDGNHRLPSGLWGQFRRKLYAHYGGPDAVDTGWVSHTLFEPHVANKILMDMVRSLKLIRMEHGYVPVEVITRKKRSRKNMHIEGVQFEDENGDKLLVNAKITIDATEYGTLLALSGIDFRNGREAYSDTGEPGAPQTADNILQDITYVAILKDYGKDADKTVPRPENYDPAIFMNCCREYSDGKVGDLVDARRMLNYGRLPGNKYMINWPKNGNDFYGDYLNMSAADLNDFLQKAKNHTLCFVYFIQTELGFKNLGLADDEFPTGDQLPFIPYIRESRRAEGLVTLTVNDLIDPYVESTAPHYQSAICVGDYPLDHHHTKATLPEPEQFPAVQSISVPYGCLVPGKADGFMVAEKSISVTHAVNGCTRLQPVVMQIGQAAGAAAALCVKQNIQPREVDIRELQQVLMDERCQLLPFCDVPPQDRYFQSIQKIALCGIMKGQGISNNWVNETRFLPQNRVNKNDVRIILTKLAEHLNLDVEYAISGIREEKVERSAILNSLWRILGSPEAEKIEEKYYEYDNPAVSYFGSKGLLDYWHEGDNLIIDKPLLRGEFAYFIDKIFDPFTKVYPKNGVA